MIRTNTTRILSRGNIQAIRWKEFQRWTSTTAPTPKRYGFVGLGQMGYPMAMNLLRKTTPQSTFTIYDVNPMSLSRFVNESASIPNSPSVSVAHHPKDLAERSVLPNSESN